MMHGHRPHDPSEFAAQVAGADLGTLVAWACNTLKPHALKLQERGGPPAIWTAAQACHESAYKGGLSALARDHNNLWGVKAADWQKSLGCTEVAFDTWEYIGGEWKLAKGTPFCSAPDLETGFKMYETLLQFDRYKGALAYRDMPLLYGLEVWHSGWATSPDYITGEWGTGYWIKALFGGGSNSYRDTTPVRTVPAPMIVQDVVRIENGRGRLLAAGRLDGNRTEADIRPLLESLGYTVGWQQGAKGGPHTAIVKRVRGLYEDE